MSETKAETKTKTKNGRQVQVMLDGETIITAPYHTAGIPSKSRDEKGKTVKGVQGLSLMHLSIPRTSIVIDGKPQTVVMFFSSDNPNSGEETETVTE